MKDDCLTCLFILWRIAQFNIAIGVVEGGTNSESVQVNTVSSSLRCFFGVVLSRRLGTEMDPATGYTLRAISRV